MRADTPMFIAKASTDLSRRLLVYIAISGITFETFYLT